MKKRWICSAEGKSQKTDNDLLGTRVKVTRCDGARQLPSWECNDYFARDRSVLEHCNRPLELGDHGLHFIRLLQKARPVLVDLQG